MVIGTKFVFKLAFLILHLNGLLSTGLKVDCPKDWKRFENSCYMSPSSLTSDWFGSQANCSQYNAHLVTISSERENSFLIREIVTIHYYSHFWIGLKRAPFDYSLWTWVDGSRVTFTDWYAGEPNDASPGEACGEFIGLGNNARWNDLTCSRNIRFICEKVLIADLPTCSDDNGGCPHICLSTIHGPKCKCKDGFISEKDGTVCIDPTMFTSQKAQTQTIHSFDVALLIFQLLSFILLFPVSCVLVSFYKRVSNQRRLKRQQTIPINSPTVDGHGFENQASTLTNADNSCGHENTSEIQV